MSARHSLKTIPDPARAHGAWVFLALAILAGALSAIGTGVVPALAAGAAFAGVFILASAAGARGAAPRRRRILFGTALLAGGATLTILEDAPLTWLVFAAAAILPVAVAGYFAFHSGFRSSHTLAFAVLALALAAPASACAGGASPLDALLLLALLVPVYVWRAVLTGRRIAESSSWTRARLRRQGLLEAAYALAWTTAAVLLLHALST